MSKVWEATFGDVAPRSPAGIICCGCCSIVAFVLILLFFPCTVLQLGQMKLGLAKNSVTGVVDMETVYQPGRYWLGFWKEFIEFDSVLCTIDFSNEAVEEGVQQLSELRSRDQDGKQIFLSVSIQYQLVPTKIGLIYREMTTLYEDVFISELRDGLSKAFNLLEVLQVWDDYEGVNRALHERCKAVLRLRHANCWGLQLWGLRLESQYEDALIRTQVQKQKEHTARAALLVSKVRAGSGQIKAMYEAEIVSTNARGGANAIEIKREAVAQAEANTIRGNAMILSATRALVVPNGSSPPMSASQLVTYRKWITVKAKPSAQLVYNIDLESDSIDPVNVQSAGTLMGGGRRLPTDLSAPSANVATRSDAGGEEELDGPPEL